MISAIPIGKTESGKLEFKRRDARPIDIGREVVAFFNASGGQIWWGIREDAGKAAAEDPFSDGEARRRDLQNHLIDTIEPSPKIPEEVSIDLVAAVAHGQQVMVIKVQKARGDRAPVAQIKDNGRRYWLRVADRVRTMSRAEIARTFAESRQNRDAEDLVPKRLLDARERIQKEKRPCFWMKIQPVPELRLGQIDVDDDDLRKLLMDPAATSNRHGAWTFVRELQAPISNTRGIHTGSENDGYVEIQRDGAIEFRLPLDRLHWKGKEHEIWPFALLEFPVSLMRLGGRFIGGWCPDVASVLVDCAFVGLRGWSLREGSPLSPQFPMVATGPGNFSEDDLVPMLPFRFEREQIIDEPDRCGLRLITFVYEAFGYGAEAIPPEFDRLSGKLVIPAR